MAVRLQGAIALRKALRAFEPDLAKETTKEMGKALKPIVQKARGFLPAESLIISNWRKTTAHENWRFPTYDYTKAKAGIRYKTTPSRPNSKGFVSLAQVLNKSAAGAIYETAGRKNPNSVFVTNLAAKSMGVTAGSGKMMGRVIFRAWEEDHGKAQDGVIRAIEKAAQLFKERTNG